MSFTPEDLAIIEKAFDDAIAKSPTLQLHLEGALRDIRGKTEQSEQEPVGYWQGKFSQDGGAVLYEVPQASAFGYHYPNYPVYAAPQPVKQEPVAWTATRLWNRKDTWKCSADIEKDLLYAAPVRTKDLTDDEIEKAVLSVNTTMEAWITYRAVIAKDREKNK